MKQAVILAAGEGQRLRPFTATKPKVMLTIADKPILQYVIEALAQNGIRNIVLVVGYRREQIFDYMGKGDKFGVEITYVIQDRQLGTAHALAQAEDAVATEFLVLPGDNLIGADTVSHLSTLKPNAMLVKRVDNPVRYGVVTIDNGTVTNIMEKPQEATSNIINTGIYTFDTEIFNSIERELDIPDVLNKMIVQGYPMTALEIESTWLDVVYPWDILRLNDNILRQIPASTSGIIESGVTLKGQVSVGKDTVIRSHSYIDGPAVIGAGCDIGPNVCITAATSIGDNVVISPFTQIKNSVIGDDICLGPSCIIQDSVIDKGCVIEGHFTAFSRQAEVKVDGEYHLVSIGAMLGEGCCLSSGVIAQPGVIVGNYCQIQEMKLISSRLPDRSVVY